jgi:hypothetical protein
MTRFAIALSGIVLNTLLANLFLVRWLNCSIPVPLTLLNLSINIGILILLFYLIQHTQGNHQHTQALLQKSMDDLELRVAERTAELLKVNESLQHELEERKLPRKPCKFPRPALLAFWILLTVPLFRSIPSSALPYSTRGRKRSLAMQLQKF